MMSGDGSKKFSSSDDLTNSAGDRNVMPAVNFPPVVPPHNFFVTNVPTSLDLLAPNNILDYDDMQLEDVDSEFMSENEVDGENDDDLSFVDTGRTSSLFKIAEPPHTGRAVQQTTFSDSDSEEAYMAVRKLALYGGDEDVTVTSDEERSIVREIKDEIKKNVEGEMQHELEVYRAVHKNSAANSDGKQPNTELNDVDPKLKEAILKMRKLDRILERKFKQEKKVKRDRLLLQKRLREELDGICATGREQTAEEKKNTEKFLALTLPPSHNAGIRINDDTLDDLESPAVTPLFQTQPPDVGIPDSYRSHASVSSNTSKRGSLHKSTTGRGDSACLTPSTLTGGRISVDSTFSDFSRSMSSTNRDNSCSVSGVSGNQRGSKKHQKAKKKKVPTATLR